MNAVLDAHHHLWDPAQREYPWMIGEQAASWRRRFGLEHLREVTARAGIERTVLVQTVSSLAETQDFLATAADSDGLIGAVVGWADLAADDLPDVLTLLRCGPGGALLAGIRHQVEDEADPDWLVRPPVRRGARAVAAAGLVHDLLVRPDQLPAATELVADLPQARFVLDHAAKPPMRERDLYARWAADVARLAARPNVACKLSGLFTLGGDAAAVGRTLDHLLAVFGPQRLIFGSDWPVSIVSGSYPDTLERTRALIADLSPTERDAVLHANAERTYGIPALPESFLP